MAIENLLARHISSSEAKMNLDESCKKLLSHKIILAWIMKECLEEYHDIEIKEIVEQYIEGEPFISQEPVHMDEKEHDLEDYIIEGLNTEDSSIVEGKVTYDIFYSALICDKMLDREINKKSSTQIYINIEAQKDFHPGYPIVKRGIYYTGRMISRQYGIVFSKSHYEKIKKVYSIWICTDVPQYRKNTITKYNMMEQNVVGNVKEKVENYDLMSVIIICLGDEDQAFGVLRLLDILLASKKKVSEKKKILEKDFRISMTVQLESEVKKMCNYSEYIEERGEIRLIKNLMKNMTLTIEEAMSALEIEKQKQERYKYLIDNQYYE